MSDQEVWWRVVSSEEGLFNLSVFWVLALVVMGLGVALLLPGVYMRLEKVPVPEPFVRVHLCPTKSGSFKGSSTPCPENGVLDDKLVPADAMEVQLHSSMLVSGVAYVPVIVMPDVQLGGHVAIKLAQNKKAMFSITQKLDDFSGSHVLARKYRAGDKLRMYEKFRRSSFDNLRCTVVTIGCEHVLEYNAKELILEHTRFVVQPADDLPVDVYVANATLTVQSAYVPREALQTSGLVDKTGNLLMPEIYISFRQLELSELQESGVSHIIMGATIVLIAAALCCIQSITSREKRT